MENPSNRPFGSSYHYVEDEVQTDPTGVFRSGRWVPSNTQTAKWHGVPLTPEEKAYRWKLWEERTARRKKFEAEREARRAAQAATEIPADPS